MPQLPTHCECGAKLTPEDVAANASDAIELTDGLGCRACLNHAAGFAPREKQLTEDQRTGDPAFVISTERVTNQSPVVSERTFVDYDGSECDYSTHEDGTVTITAERTAGQRPVVTEEAS